MALVLAIEPDIRQGTILTRVVRELVGADLVLVESRDAAIAAINPADPRRHPRDGVAVAARRRRADRASPHPRRCRTLADPHHSPAGRPARRRPGGEGRRAARHVPEEAAEGARDGRLRPGGLRRRDPHVHRPLFGSEGRGRRRLPARDRGARRGSRRRPDLAPRLARRVGAARAHRIFGGPAVRRRLDLVVPLRMEVQLQPLRVAVASSRTDPRVRASGRRQLAQHRARARRSRGDRS